MYYEELVNDYNQWFLKLLKWIPQDYKTTEEISIEFYTSGFPMSMVMFVKKDEKATLEEDFQEALKVVKNMLSLKGNHGA